MYLKRSRAQKTWPIPRKGSIYLVKPLHNKKSGIPLLIVMRDVLEIVKNRKELKKILNSKQVKINNKIIKDEKFPLLVFDKLEIGNEIYKVSIGENGKFQLEEVKKLDTKIAKIINKKILKGKKIQINLNDSRNFLVKENFKIGDSVLIDLNENKILKNISLKIGSDVFVIGGKHLGKKGKIENIDEKNKLAGIKTKEEKINVNIKNLIAVE